MSCREALETLLSADPSEMAGAGDSELARHVRECQRCGAVAARLTAETRVLASVLASTGMSWRHRAKGRPRPLVVAGLALAGIVFVSIVARRATQPAAQVERSPTAVSTGAVPPVPSTVESPRQAATVTTARAGRSRRSSANPRRYVAVQLRPANALAIAPIAATVAVEPSAGQRAAVIRTANPSVTVVWIY